MFWKVFGLLLVGLATQAATLTATSGQNSYSVGDRVSVDFTVSNVTDLYAFQFDVSFDPGVLSAQTVAEAGYFLSNGVSFSPGSIDNTAGRIRFLADALSGSSPTVNGSTTLVSVTLAAIGSGTTNVAPTNLILLNSQLSDISANAVGASLQVSEVTAVPEANSYEFIGIGLLVLAAARRVASFGQKRS